MIERLIKIVSTILFLYACLKCLMTFIVRFAALVGSTILLYQASEKQNKIEMIVYVCLAILFQPLLKISLGRENLECS